MAAHEDHVRAAQVRLLDNGLLGPARADHHHLEVHAAVAGHAADLFQVRGQFLLPLAHGEAGADDGFGPGPDHVQDNHPGAAGLAEEDGLLDGAVAEGRAVGGQQQGGGLAEQAGGKSIHGLSSSG